MQADEVNHEHITAQDIITYLQAHPGFFRHHPALLSELELPHASGQAVSLVERQIAILRERNMDMRRRMNELLEAARANDAIFTKTRSLTLALLEAESLHELNEVLATFVLVDFEADFVCAHVRGLAHSLDHIQNHADEFPFAHLYNSRAPVCTTLRQTELRQVFPVSNHGDSASAVLLPMAVKGSEGVLCIGSRDASHFRQDMDTLFVAYIADVLGKVLSRF